MKEQVDFKKRMREIKFITENCLTEEQFRQRLEDKIRRAELLRKALTQQEIQTSKFDR